MNNNVKTVVKVVDTTKIPEGLSLNDIIANNLYGFFRLVRGSKDHGEIYFRHIRRRTLITPVNVPDQRVAIHADARFVHLKSVALSYKG